MKKSLCLAAALALATAISANAQFAGKSYLQPGMKFMTEVGYAPGVGDFSLNRAEFDVVAGYQIAPYLFAGAGLGYQLFHNDGQTASGLPIFADLRAFAPINRCAPFFDFKIGYSAIDTKGVYFSPSIGLRYALDSKVGLNFSFGYEYQSVQIFEDYSGIKENFGAVTFKLGADF